MQQNILFSPISLDELETRLVARFKTEILSAPTPQPETPEDFLTAKQVSKLLGVSLVTLHKWKREGKLKFHRFGSRIRFRKSEIISAEKFKGGVK